MDDFPTDFPLPTSKEVHGLSLLILIEDQQRDQVEESGWRAFPSGLNGSCFPEFLSCILWKIFDPIQGLQGLFCLPVQVSQKVTHSTVPAKAERRYHGEGRSLAQCRCFYTVSSLGVSPVSPDHFLAKGTRSFTVCTIQNDHWLPTFATSIDLFLGMLRPPVSVFGVLTLRCRP